MSAAAKKRVFIVDDHPLVREWLTSLLNHQEDLAVCGEAGHPPEALRLIEESRPDLAIVDLSLASGSGIELLKDLRRCCPETRLVVLSMHDERLYGERALRAGARAYVMKRDTTRQILTAIRTVLEGGIYVSPEFQATTLARLFSGKAKDAGSPISQLSDRELEVFRMLGDGLETRKIGESLQISMKTVQVYCARIKEKLALENAHELLREAVRWKNTLEEQSHAPEPDDSSH